MDMQQIQQVRKILDILLRRKVLIIALALFGLAGGLAYYLKQPKVYQATALLSYQQQSISPARMSPDEQARIRDVVSTLSQLILSRTSLEQIIVDLDLYRNARQNGSMEDVVEQMRGNIEITPSRQGDTFSLSFSGNRRQEVARVANTLAAKFIEENLKYRQNRASETFTYTSSELDMAKEMLDQKEAVMRDYKLQHYNEMPDQRANNMTRLSSLQEQYQDRQNSIQDLERTRVLVQDQIAVRKQMIEENRRLRLALTDQAQGRGRPTVESDADRLIRMSEELQQLLLRYTERHPEIQLLRKRIADLEARVQPEEKQAGRSPGSGAGASEQFDTVLLDLQTQLKELGLNIKRLENEKENIMAMIEKYEGWVEAAPVREAEWSALTREYAELRNHYDFLMGQNLQAGSALNLERRQRGSQFKIEDSAREPQKPIRPDFLQIMAMAFLAGTGLGCALAFGRELLDPSFKDPGEAENFLGVELLCTVPQLTLQKEKTRGVVAGFFWFLLLLSLTVALAAAVIHYWRQGQIIL
jgi:polysaccharide chain length determinant protein (PEP-CTERM system associated)